MSVNLLASETVRYIFVSRSLSFSSGLIQHFGSRHVHQAVNLKATKVAGEFTHFVEIRPLHCSCH